MSAMIMRPAAINVLAAALRGAAVMLLCGAVAACGGQSHAEEDDDATAGAPPVTYTTIRLHGIEDTETGIATLHARRSPSISAEVEGRLLAIHVDDGQEVLENDLLAELDARDHQAEFSRSEAEVSRIRVLVDQQERDVERQRRLHDNEHISSHVLEDAEAELAALEQELRAAQSDYESAERRLSRTRVLAPYDGIISARLASEGDYADAGTTLFEMTTNGELQARIPLPEAAADRLDPGQEVRLWHRNSPDDMHIGTIEQVSPEVDRDSHSVTAIATVEHAPDGWRAGTSIEAEVVLERRDTILVPVESVVRRPSGTVVYVLDDEMVVHERPVEIGRRASEWREIVEGVEIGQSIVVDGAGFLTDAIAVEATAAQWMPATAALDDDTRSQE